MSSLPWKATKSLILRMYRVVASHGVHRHPSSQTWRTFLRNHVKDLVSADFFVVPTATFRLLFVFVILSHDRRRPSLVKMRLRSRSNGFSLDDA